MGAQLLTLGCTLLFIISFTALSSARHSLAAVYKVGDNEGWLTGVNYLDWSQKYNFTVGDILDFTYVKGQHDVYEVTESTYRSCNTSAGVISTYGTGNDLFNLTLPAKYWFLCSIKGHCEGGMRFGISVKAGNAGNNTAEVSPQPAATQPQGSEAGPGGGGGPHKGWWRSWWMADLVAAILLQLLSC